MGYKEKLVCGSLPPRVLTDAEVSLNRVEPEPMEAVDVVRSGCDRICSNALLIPETVYADCLAVNYPRPENAMVSACNDKACDVSTVLGTGGGMAEVGEEKVVHLPITAVYCKDVLFGIPLERIRLVAFFGVDMLVAYDGGAIGSGRGACACSCGWCLQRWRLTSDAVDAAGDTVGSWAR